MATYRAAIVDALGLCLTVTLLDTEHPADPPPGLTVIDLPDNSPVGPGWKWDGSIWTPPVPVPEPVFDPPPQLVSMPLSATLGVCTADLSKARTFTISPTGAFSVNLINVPAAPTTCIVPIAIGPTSASYPVTWPSGTTWMGAKPSTSVGKPMTTVTFTTYGSLPHQWTARTETAAP